MRSKRRGAFTLIELLCSLCIILILVGLMLGPVMKAFKRVKRFQYEETATVLIDRFRDAMEKHFGAATNYPERTAEQLYADGIIDTHMRDFFRKKTVKFLPFSSKTPETAPILMVEISPGDVQTLLKADIRPRE